MVRSVISMLAMAFASADDQASLLQTKDLQKHSSIKTVSSWLQAFAESPDSTVLAAAKLPHTEKAALLRMISRENVEDLTSKFEAAQP